MTEIVVRLMQNHPTGKRNRAGFTFTETPCVIQVSKEQMEAISNDPCLRIITKGTAFEQGLSNKQVQKFFKKDEKKVVIKKEVAKKEDEEQEGEGQEAEKEESNLELIQEDEEQEDEMTKKDIIAALQEKGLVINQDFNPAARKDILLQLLNS